jgi:hypothetical protein
MRINMSRILATSIAVAAMAIIIPVSLLPSAGGTFFQTATGATSATITVTVTLANTSVVTISGTAGVAGATLTYGTPDTVVIASGNGAYSFAVPYSWSGTLTPSRGGCVFSPTQRVFVNVRADTSGSGNNFTPSLIVAVEKDVDNLIPKEYMLAQNYPNPFNPSTVIRFALPRPGFASLKIYNIVGQEVANLVTGSLPAGAFRTTWDGKNMNGETVSSGVYLYRLQVGDYVEARKMLLLK